MLEDSMKSSFSNERISYINIIVGLIAIIGFLGGSDIDAEATSYGSIEGRVVDRATKKSLPWANVLVLGTVLGAATDLNGDFEIDPVPVGFHEIKAMMIGYKAVVKSDLVVNPKRATYVVIEMEEQPIELEGVTVVPDYFPKGKDAVVSTRSLDYEEVRREAGGMGDVQRIVQTLPAVVSSGDEINEIIIRGGNPGENLFMMDNIEIPNPNHWGSQGTSGGPVSMINTNFIRDVDFIAGAFPAKYGDKASSVMDVKLREGSREKTTGKFDLGMAGAGGILEGPIVDKGTYLFSARKSFLALVAGAFRLGGAIPHYYNLQGKTTYDLSRNNKLILNGIYGDEHIEYTGAWGTRSDVTVSAKSRQYSTGVTLRTLLSPNAFLLSTLYRTRSSWDTHVWDPSRDLHKNNSIEYENALNEDLVWRVSSAHEISAGVSIEGVGFDHSIHATSDTVYEYDYPDNPDSIIDTLDIYPPDIVHEDASSHKIGGYVQYKPKLFGRLTIISGLRYDYFRYTQGTAISPRLTLSYALTPRTTLNAGYGKHYQTPPYIVLSAAPENRNFEHYHATHWILGVEHLFKPDIKGVMEVYHKKYQDLPVRESDITPDPYDWSSVFVPEGESYARGMELFLQKKFRRNLYGTVAYSYSVCRDRDAQKSDEEYYPGDYDYVNVFTTVGGYKFEFKKHDWYQKMKEKSWFQIASTILPIFADEVDVSIRWRYLGGRPYTPLTYHEEHKRWRRHPETPRNSERLISYHRLDVRIDWRFYFGSWNMVTYFELQNAYNRENIWTYVYDSGNPEKDIIYQTALMPVGGLLIEF